jgi:hypothetical protein
MFRQFQNLTISLLCTVITVMVGAVPVDVKSITIRESNTSIRIDGILDEPAWLRAEPALDFFQRYPADTSEARTLTEVKLTYDQEFFFVGAVCYDHIDGDYVVESLRRDYNESSNDALNIIIDPFSDLTNGFLFGITPYGGCNANPSSSMEEVTTTTKMFHGTTNGSQRYPGMKITGWQKLPSRLKPSGIRKALKLGA